MPPVDDFDPGCLFSPILSVLLLSL